MSAEEVTGRTKAQGGFDGQRGWDIPTYSETWIRDTSMIVENRQCIIAQVTYKLHYQHTKLY